MVPYQAQGWDRKGCRRPHQTRLMEGYAPDIFGENGSLGQMPTFLDLLNKMYIYISIQIILYGKYLFLVMGTAFLILLINKYVDWSIEKSYLDESAMEEDSDK